MTQLKKAKEKQSKTNKQFLDDTYITEPPQPFYCPFSGTPG